jgi:hypothetical protein
LGNPHPGQFSELVKRDRVRGVQLRNMEDGGVGPLISDLFRYRTSLLASRVAEPLEHFFLTYKLGLSGVEPRVPGAFHYALYQDLSDLVSRRRRQVKFFTDATRSHFLSRHGLLKKVQWDADSLETWKESQSALEKALAPRRLLDVAVKESEGLKHFYFLTAYKGRKDIFEARSLTQPAVAHYQGQEAHEKRIEELRRRFWPREARTIKRGRRNLKKAPSGDEFQVVATENYAFWLHPHMPLQLEFQQMDNADQYNWAVYVTQKLGFLHSKNPAAPAFLRALKTHEKLVLALLRDLPQVYLDELQTSKIMTPAR